MANIANNVPASAATGFLSSLPTSFTNVTASYLRTVSPKDLVYLPLRGIAKLDNLIVRRIPDSVVRQVGIAGSAITGVIGPLLRLGTNDGVMADAVAHVAADPVIADLPALGWKAMISEAFQASTFKSYFGMLHYLTSRWAFTCFALALLLNRVQIYASTRQRIFLTWEKRLALRIVPILLLGSQIYQIMQATRCQSSPEFALYRHGDINKYTLLDWAPEGGAMYQISSTLLYSSSDEDCCAAVGMSRPSANVRAPFGSFSLLWPSFLRLSLSHLVETISCHLQQQAIMTEVGMSIFEHSLAFAEAETMISHTLGVGLFGATKTTNNTTAATSTTIPASGTLLVISDATKSLTGPHLMDRINVPVEVLLVALLSCCNAMSSNIISVLGKQKQWRLVNTGFWAIAFMTAFMWGFFTKSVMVRVGGDGHGEDMRAVSGLLHFPTVAIIGFLPHLLIILGMLICGAIYVVALILTAVSLDSNNAIHRPTSLWDRIRIAHNNLQVTMQLRSFEIKWHEDFYTALLRIGFAVLTAATEAVFLNEGHSVEMRQFTWLEEERLDDIDSTRRGKSATDGGHFHIAEAYGFPEPGSDSLNTSRNSQSGYAKERKLNQGKETEILKDGSTTIYPNPRTGGVGAIQRTTRFYFLLLYFRGIIYLIGGYIAYGVGALLDRIGITARPAWLRSIVGKSVKQARLERGRGKDTSNDGSQETEIWFLDENRRGDLDTDIEAEMRRKLEREFSGTELEEQLNQKTYEWWRSRGWYGSKDESGDYQPSQPDDFDTTSVVSMSSATSTAEETNWESESEGRRTPTQTRPEPSWSFSHRSRSPTPITLVNDTPLDATALARLLNPRDRASKEEARMLAAHFASSSETQIMTRSRYRHQLEAERSRVLLAGRRPTHLPGAPNDTSIPTYQTVPLFSDEFPANRPLTDAEEADILETLIISRRSQKSASDTAPINNSSSADQDDNHYHTPPCVVCQTAPRTIIAWPCRCLCVCEDCRVNLALNNFGNCVTCRRSVGGFVRLYVP